MGAELRDHRRPPPGLARVQADVQRTVDAGEVRLSESSPSATRFRRAGRGRVEVITFKPLSKNPGALQAAYMAPEQAKGLTVDKRADIWAYGAVLFEMLTGKKLFEAGDVSEMLASVLIKDPDISSMGAHVPDHVRSVVRHCLVKDPKRRLRDIGDVRLAMEGTFETTVRAPSELVVASTLPAWLRQRPVTLAIALLASLAAGGLAVWSLTRPAPQPGQITRFPIPLPADQALSFLGRPLVAISPDGSQIVYVANRSLWLRPVDQLQAVQVPGTEEGRGPFFSPDGRSIGFYAPEALRKVSVSGGAAVTIADGLNNPSGASWGATT